MAFLKTVRIQGYRSARDVELQLGAVTALVGEARSGKSNLLRAVRALLDPDAPPPSREDLRGRADELSDRGAALRRPPDRARRASARAAAHPPPWRAAARVPPGCAALGLAARARRLLRRGRGGRPPVPARALRDPPERRSDSAGASALVAGIDACCEAKITGAVFLVEEPELFLRPHTQRYLYRRLRALAGAGNQVLYSTHAPAFLNVARLEELVLVRYSARRGTHIVQPKPLEADEAFRVVSEFDAERSELFLARAAILVEGRTEKLVLPSFFAALGHDADRAQISIVECGGKSNIPVFARICKACRIPFVVVHDRDAPRGRAADSGRGRAQPADRGHRRPRPDGRARARTSRASRASAGHANKPERAWNHFGAGGRRRCPSRWSGRVRLALQAAAR